MTAPMRGPSTEGALQRVLAETTRMVAPSAADRERITETLRARLGAAILPEGFVPAAGGAAAASSAHGTAASGSVTAAGGSRAPVPPTSAIGSATRTSLGRRGWLSLVVGTGVVAGALGFVLGHGMAERERDAARDGERAIAAAAAPGPAELSAAERSGAKEPAVGASTQSGAQAATAASAPRTLVAEREAPVRRRDPVERAGRAAAIEASGSLAPQAPRLSFSDVLERLQRANVALRRGQGALALIQLAELDRGAGEVLREEREATRALALCAIGDAAGARRAAAPLLSGSASSIYAPRLDSSCAREAGR